MSGTFQVDEDHAQLLLGHQTLSTVAGDLTTHKKTVTAAVTSAIDGWTGPRNDTFTQASGGVQIQLQHAHRGCADVAGILADYARDVRKTQNELDDLKRQHDSATGGHDGDEGVGGPRDIKAQNTARLAVEAKRALARKAQRYAARIDAVTDKVAPASDHLSPDQIRREVTGEMGTGGKQDSDPSIRQALGLLGGATRAAPPGSVNDDGTVNWELTDPHDVAIPTTDDPSTVNNWWTSLSPEEQNYLLRHHPKKLGNLDGIPVADRDFANRSVLPDELKKLKAKMHKQFPDGEPPKTVDGYTRYQHVPRKYPNKEWEKWNTLHGRIKGTEDIQHKLRNESANPPYYLVGFQPTVGNGRAILSQGNPDTADDTSVFVTGMNTRLGGIDTDLGRSEKMRASALRAGADNDHLATITWYGYDAPQGLGEAASTKYAERGAPKLDSFASGLRATHHGEPAHTTVVSHSYGTTMTGFAASHGHTLDVDDVVMVASPGAGVGHGWFGADDPTTVDSLHLSGKSRGHVYATRSKSDMIRWVDGTHLGIDPVRKSFGAHIFGANPEGDHSGYWDPSDPHHPIASANPALVAMGQVIAGEGKHVKSPTEDQDSSPSDHHVPDPRR